MLRSAWVALELSSEGEDLVVSGRLAAHIRADLGVPKTYPVIVPAVRGSSVAALSYVFIREGLPPGRYLALERKGYAERVLSRQVGNLRTMSLVSGKEVDAMLRAVEKPRVVALARGQVVEVVSGPYLRVRGRTMTSFSSRELLIQVRTRTLLRLLVVDRADVVTVDDKTVPQLFVPDLRHLKRTWYPKDPPATKVAPSLPPPVPSAFTGYKQMSLFL